MRSATRMSVLFLAAAHLSANAGEQLARLTDGNVFFAEPKLTGKAMHNCQPLKGERVVVLGVQQAAEGIRGLDFAEVRVLDGQCSGQHGWVGTARLEAVQR